METAFLFGFILIALGLAAGAMRGSPIESARRIGRSGVPALLIGTGTVILGGGLTLWLGGSLLALADAASFDPSTLARGLGPTALGAAAVGLAAGLAAPGVGRWTWGLLASLLPWLLTGALWVSLLVVPDALDAVSTYAREEGVAAAEVRRSIWRLLTIVTAYPVLALLGATGGATLARALPRRRRAAASVSNGPPAPEAASGGKGLGIDGTEVVALHLVPVGESWCHRVFEDSEELAFLEILPGAREGGFELQGSYYRVVPETLGRFQTLEWRGRPLARADLGITRRRARLLFGDRELSLRPRFALAPVIGTLLLEESGRRTGWVEGGSAELPRDLPLPVRLFVIYVALVLRMTWRISEV